MRLKLLLFMVIGLLLLSSSVITEYLAVKPVDFDYALNSFKDFLNKRANELNQQTNRLIKSDCPDFSQTDKFNKEEYRGLYWFAYTDEDILFWSGNSVPLTSDMIRNKADTVVWKLRNGWYLARRYQQPNCTILALALLRHDYSYQNEYLIDGWYGEQDFQLKIDIPESTTTEGILYREPVTGNLMRIQQENNVQQLTEQALVHPIVSWSLWLALAGIVFIFIGGHRLYAYQRARKAAAWWLLLLLLRLVFFQTHLPHIFYDLPLFSPSDYAASDWLPTLGDLLLNTSLILYGAFLLYLHRESVFNYSGWILSAITLVMLYAGIVFAFHIIRGLILHSSISLDFSDIFNINSSSVIAFLIIVMIFGIIYLLVEVFFFLNPGNKKHTRSRYLIVLLLTVTALLIFPKSLAEEFDLFILSGCLLTTLIILDFLSKDKGYTRIIGMLTVFALAGNYLILHDTDIREMEKRKLLAIKISAERDPIAESLFREIEDEILNDTLIKSYLKPTTVIPPGQIRDLAQLYFNGYWEKYNISVNVFGTDECPLANLYTTLVSEPLLFDRAIDSIGLPTQSRNFFYMDKGSGRISYLARLQIVDNDGQGILGTLYIDFQSRYTPEEIGYPELLLDQMTTSNTDMSNYSYARYKDGILVSHFGNYVYPLQIEPFKANGTDPFSIQHQGGYEHLNYQAATNSLVILSLPERNIIALLTPFSYLMLISGLIVLLVLLSEEMRLQKKLVISFKRRIQIFIVGILLLALFTVSFGTLIFLIRNNFNKNQRAISEKIHSVLIETEYNLYNDEGLNPFKSNDIAYLLTRQANIFFADINLFDLSGQLFASSRMKIFEEGLVSKKMHPEAYYEMRFKQNTEYIHNEQTGLLKYLSAYVPIRNKENKVIAYLNLPYFAKQSELKREISVFLVTIINIYVFLIVLVVIAAIILSNRITEPLRLIQERLGRIRLGRQNEIIAWKGNDEIASLIAEYNRMVEELTLSAEKLARSERESAWREMAKQVAHEIKNPLTPIKLSIQHLNIAWKDKAPDFNQRLERFSNTLIEQIDTLSHIATEFSNFAQMPRMSIEPVDLNEMLVNVVDFFSNAENTSLSCHSPFTGKCMVKSDKEQLLRVFNNLIRNAIQSIPDDRHGIIAVELKRDDQYWLISVSDNGSGIPEAIREKIFNPNFTTRTGGMGLGLALVKNIIESSGGQVSFSTVIGKGSSFYVKLPIADIEKDSQKTTK